MWLNFHVLQALVLCNLNVLKCRTIRLDQHVCSCWFYEQNMCILSFDSLIRLKALYCDNERITLAPHRHISLLWTCSHLRHNKETHEGVKKLKPMLSNKRAYLDSTLAVVHFRWCSMYLKARILYNCL